MTIRVNKQPVNIREKFAELDGKVNKNEPQRAPSFRADLSNNQSFANGVTTKYAASTVHWDTHNAYDTSTYEYVVPIGGIYLITFMNWWGTSSGDRDVVRLYVNGSVVASDYAFTPGGGTLSAEFVWNLNVNDRISIYIKQDSGGTLTFDANNQNNGFTATKIA